MKSAIKSWAWKRPWMMFTVFFLSICQAVTSQPDHINTRCRALGSCISTEPGNNIYGLPGLNPASIAGAETAMISVGHTLPFLVPEIGISSLELFVPVLPGTFRFSSAGCGLPGFRYFNHLVSYGMKLHSQLYAGVLFQLTHIMAAEDWHFRWHFGPGIGCIFLPDSETGITLCILNPLVAGNISRERHLAPGLVSLGAWRTIYENTRLMVEVSYHTIHLLRWKTGLEYAPLSSLRFGTGFHTQPTTLTAGFGFRKSRLLIDGSIEWSALPGITPGLTLTYLFNR